MGGIVTKIFDGWYCDSDFVIGSIVTKIFDCWYCDSLPTAKKNHQG